MTSIWDRANPQLRDLAVYEPGKPIEETARELEVDPGAIIKLASNENPLGPSPKAIQAMRAALENAQLYPDGDGFYLRSALAARLGFARENIILGNGSNEVIEFLGHAFLNPGDDVIVSEHAFIAYKLIATLFGARTIETPSPHYEHDLEAMLNAITPKTRIVMLNTPLNPIGRVFDVNELAMVAHVLERSDAVAICDEVYEHLVFDGRAHLPLIGFPGMEERVVRVGSAGKMFSLTGWKVGWVTGAVALIDVIAKAHQFITFTTPPALQRGTAYALSNEMDFTLGLTRTLQDNRDLLADRLARMGFDVLPCEGTYFLTAGIGALTNERDGDFCRRLVREAGVALIPLSAFFETGEPSHLVRFAFCKKRALLEEAMDRLERFFAGQVRV